MAQEPKIVIDLKAALKAFIDLYKREDPKDLKAAEKLEMALVAVLETSRQVDHASPADAMLALSLQLEGVLLDATAMFSTAPDIHPIENPEKEN